MGDDAAGLAAHHRAVAAGLPYSPPTPGRRHACKDDGDDTALHRVRRQHRLGGEGGAEVTPPNVASLPTSGTSESRPQRRTLGVL